MTTISPSSDPAKNERMVRIVLVVGLAPILPCAAFIVWIVGYDAHPHRLWFAYVEAVVFTIVMVVSQVWLYRVWLKQAQAVAAPGRRRSG